MVVRVTLDLGDDLVDWTEGWSRMHGKHQGLGSLGLTPAQLDRGQLAQQVDTATEGRQSAVAGELVVRWGRHDDVLIMWLSGALDQATVTLLDHELDELAVGMTRLLVDLTGLEFINSPGLDALVGLYWRASKRGDRLSFRHGSRIARRPVELTRTVRPRSRWAARTADVRDDDFYFALAIACVDIDHPWSGDPPEAA